MSVLLVVVPARMNSKMCKTPAKSPPPIYQHSAFCSPSRYPTMHSRHCNKPTYFGSMQWRRSVVKYGGQGQSGQAIRLFQALEKLVLPSIFDTSLSSLMMWNLLSYQTTVLNERMWHLGESKHTLTPTKFQGSRPHHPRIYSPGSCVLTGLWPVDPAVSSDVYIVPVTTYELE